MNMYIRVKVSPKAKKESLESVSEDTFKICVKEPAKNNQANVRVKELIAEHFHVPIGAVRIVSGHRSPTKLLSVKKE